HWSGDGTRSPCSGVGSDPATQRSVLLPTGGAAVASLLPLLSAARSPGTNQIVATPTPAPATCSRRRPRSTLAASSSSTPAATLPAPRYDPGSRHYAPRRPTLTPACPPANAVCGRSPACVCRSRPCGRPPFFPG